MKFLTLVLCVAFFRSYGQQEEFAWLVGTWHEEGKQAFEVWGKEKDFLSAESYQVKDGRKIATEEIKLTKKGNYFYYVPDVAGPQGPVAFTITSWDKNSFTAENPQHDFPQKITYEKIDESHFKATISGGNKKISYSFAKKPND